MSELSIVYLVAVGCVALAFATITYLLLLTPYREVSESGPRGYRRQCARQLTLFAIGEPVLRVFAAWVAILPIADVRKQVDKLLLQAGYILGLTPDEFIACSAIAGALGASMAAMTVPNLWLAAALLSASLPYLLTSSRRTSRAQAITRALPGTIQLLALCVSAGMDLTGALRELVRTPPGDDDPLTAELRWLLQDIELGHARRQALKGLAERASGDGVSDLVAALIQSEEKGNPLGELLSTQASMLQIRRSHRAEEMANKAAIKMLVPLAMLMVMILAIVMVPLALDMQGQGL